MSKQRITEELERRITEDGVERVIEDGVVWEEARAASGRHPFNWIEVEVERCSLDYGTAPCSAALGVTGAHKCFKGWETCQDQPNFSPVPFWVRACEPVADVPLAFDFADPGLPHFPPILKRVDHEPGLPNPGESLGGRAQFTAELADAPHHDRGIDDYVDERAYDPMQQGTALRKLKARFPHYVGRRIRWYQGYLGERAVLDGFRKREYVQERWEGPDAKGRMRIVAKDVLKLLDDDRAQAPRKSKGELAAALDAVTAYTQIDVATPDAAEYDLKALESAEYVRIGDEIFTYTGTTPISGGVRLTGVTRAAPSPYVTQKAAHAIDDLVQRCRLFQGTVAEVFYELFVDYGGISPSFIPKDEWDNEALTWLAGDDITRLVTEPEGVKTLADEIIEQTLTWAVWFDEVDQQIRFRAVHPVDVGETVLALADAPNIVAGSIQITDTPERLVNEVQVLYGQADPVKGKDEVENYRRGVVEVDSDSQSSHELGKRRIKRILARWHPPNNTAVVLRHATRTLKSRVKNLMTVQFQLERKDENIRTADFVDLTTLYVIDQFGVPRTTRVQVIRADASGERVTYKAREDFFKGAFARWAPESLDGLLYDAATAEQKSKYMFWADAADGKLGAAGDDGKTWA